MIIYAITPKDKTIKEVYIGKTKNLKSRKYSHKSFSKHSNQKKYVWMRKHKFENLDFSEIFTYSDSDTTDYESIYIQKYLDLGYTVVNSQLNNYHPVARITTIDHKAIWIDYCNGMSRIDITIKHSISDSLISKVLSEFGGSNRKPKLFGKYDEIKQKIKNGVPMKRLAKEYGVAPTAIKNINSGITAFDEKEDYPLNKYVRDKIKKDSQFKPKV